MPIYVFKCYNCEEEEEAVIPVSALETEIVICPKCSKTMTLSFQPFSFTMSDKPRKQELTGWKPKYY